MRSPFGYTSNWLPMKEGGEVTATNHLHNILATAGDGTITDAMIAAGIVRRTTVGAPYTDTFPSAEAIRLALQSPPKNSSFLFMFQNSVAQAMTFAAGQGVTTLGTVSVAASRTRLYNIVVLNDTPATVVLGTTVNGSPTISGLTEAQVAAISQGQLIFGTGIAAAASVQSFNRAAGTVTMTANATASNSNVSITFTPVILIHGIGELTL